MIKVFPISVSKHFAVRVLPPNRAVIGGNITDEAGKLILEHVVLLLEQGSKEIARIRTDTSGSYRLSVYPAQEEYNLKATCGAKGGWWFDIRLREGENRRLNLTLKKSISISGTLLMLDNATPHTGVPVQAIQEGKIVATLFSD